jgi:uncharacterized protein
VEELIPLELVDVRVDQATNNPVVILRVAQDVPDRDSLPTLLPIFIGNIEAQAIRIGLEGRVTPRPMTHDLLASVIMSANAAVRAIVITETRENIFFAELRLQISGTEDVVTVSARPSDAVAVAVRVGAPLFARRELIEQNGLTEAIEADDDNPEEIVEEFRQFLDDINPDDFNS